MKNSYVGVLQLIQNALWKTDIKESGDYNWNEIDDIVQKHMIGSLLTSINQEVFIPKAIKDKWVAMAAYQILNNRRLLADQDSMLKILSNAGISVAIIKGAASSQYYLHPDLRPMGDVDFIVLREQFEEAYRILADNGFSLIQPRSATERAIELEHNGFVYELHRYFAVFNDAQFAKQFDDLIMEGVERAEKICFGGYYIPVLPDLINGLILLQHINQHLGKGIGLRQIIDWMMFFSKVIVSADVWNEFHKYTVLVGLDKLENHITTMCIDFLGLLSPIDAYHAEKDICCDLLQYILSSGNFGQSLQESERKMTVFMQNSRSFGQGLRTLHSRGRVHWKAAQKYAVLRPFASLYQIFYYFKMMLRRELSAKEFVSLLKKYNEKQDFLEAIGARTISKGRSVYQDGEYVIK